MSYTYEKIQFKSFNNINTVVGHVYTPKDVEFVGILQIIHGMAEYIERYEELADFLCEKGYIVVGVDHIGHGESIEKTDDLGYFYVKDGAEAMVRDARTLFELISEKYPSLPYFMFGHSMGSMVLRKYLMQYGKKDLKAAIISGTGGPNALVNGGLIAGKAIRRVKGDKYRSDLVNKLAFGAYNDRYENAKTDYDWLSRDEKEVAKYIADDKCGFVFTISAMISMLGMLKEINQKKAFEKYPKDLPTLIISGSMDPVGEYGKGIRIVYEHLKEAGVSDLSIKIYPEARHELTNEINKEEVYEDIFKFINSKNN